ncbi:MAG: hypothetical protein ACLUD0_08920 [Eubacterium ramulus]
MEAFSELADAKETLAEKSQLASEAEQAHADALEALNEAMNTGKPQGTIIKLAEAEYKAKLAAEEAAKSQDKAAG